VDERTTFTERGNEGFIDSYQREPKSLEEMLALFKVDREVWDVEKYVVNSWEQSQKTSDGSLVIPLYQVKVWLRRKVAILTELPAVHPVQVRCNGGLKKTGPRHGDLKKALIVPDSQNGYRKDMYSGKLDPLHDRSAWDLTLQIAKDVQPDTVIFMGDMLDLPEWSTKYYRSPDFFFTTQPSLVELAWWFGRFRNVLPNAVMKYIQGNHELRMDRAIGEHLQQAYMLRPVDAPNSLPFYSLVNLLGLERLGIEFLDNYPHGEVWLGPGIRCTHGEGDGRPDKAVKEVYHTNVVGHCHKQILYSRTLKLRWGRHVVQVLCPGTIARIDGAVPAASSRIDWQQGIAVVEYLETSPLFNLSPILFQDEQAFYNGKLYSANFDLEQLRKDTGIEAF
jgi:hypothetical protein